MTSDVAVATCLSDYVSIITVLLHMFMMKANWSGLITIAFFISVSLALCGQRLCKVPQLDIPSDNVTNVAGQELEGVM
jgi:hypothetical protein